MCLVLSSATQLRNFLDVRSTTASLMHPNCILMASWWEGGKQGEEKTFIPSGSAHQLEVSSYISSLGCEEHFPASQLRTRSLHPSFLSAL